MRYNSTSDNIEQKAGRKDVNRSIQIIGHDWPEKNVRNYNTQATTTPIAMQKYDSDEEGNVQYGTTP